MIRTLAAEDIARLLPMSDAIDVAAHALRAMSSGEGEYPVRTRLALARGDALVMPGFDGRAHFGVKVVTVHPDNVAQGKPGTRASYLLTSAEDGEPLLLCDGTALTALRTGAACGVATSRLAAKDASVLAIFGAGSQARTQIEAVCAVRPISAILVVGRDERRTDAFVASVRTRFPHIACDRAQARDAVSRAHVVTTATTSSRPVLSAEWVRAGIHVNAIGSYRADMVELDPALLARSTVYVDRLDLALGGAGEIIAAIDMKLIAGDSLIELGTTGEGSRRTRDEITVFKTVGHAALDLFTAIELLRRAGG